MTGVQTCALPISFAHLLHLLGTLESAHSTGLSFRGADESFFAACPALHDPYTTPPAEFPQLLEAWYRVSCATNLLNRSVGQPDLYPFVLNEAVTTKLKFIFTTFRKR